MQRREAEPCREVAPSLEGLGRRRQRGNGRRANRPYAGDGHQSLGFRIIPGASGNLAVEHCHLLIQRAELFDEQRQDLAGGFGDGRILVLYLCDKLGYVEEALRNHQPKFGKMARIALMVCVR